MSHNLLQLPHEVLHSILTNVDPQDIGKVPCCRALRDFLNRDRLLFKELYLGHFDEPRSMLVVEQDPTEPAWEEELQKLVRVRKILESADADLKKAHIEIIAKSVDWLTKTSVSLSGPPTSRNLGFLAELFGNQKNVDVLLGASSLYDWARSHSTSHPPQCPRRQENIEAMTPLEEHSPEPSTIEGSSTFEDATDLSHVFISSHDLSATNSATLQEPSGEPTSSLSGPGSVPSRTRQLSAKMHCLYGVPITHVRKNALANSTYTLRSNSLAVHPYARSRVYDLRQHTDGSFWGPFTDDGSQEVDWEKIEGTMIILHHNMRLFASTHRECSDQIPAWDQPFAGANPKSYVSEQTNLPMEPSVPLEASDPYNVTGTWIRIVCFLDYTELHTFNFPDDELPQNELRPPIDTEEATRLITMRIRVTKIVPPGEEDGQDLPVVHFKGTSSSLRPSWDPNANSKIRGTVKLTPKGEVRWTTFSIFHGVERWRSEGIQVGGVQSARGVLGFWFDKNFDRYGPAGPTAFWKSYDGIEEKTSASSTLAQLGLHGLHFPHY